MGGLAPMLKLRKPQEAETVGESMRDAPTRSTMPLAPPMTGNDEFIPTLGDDWRMVYGIVIPTLRVGMLDSLLDKQKLTIVTNNIFHYVARSLCSHIFFHCWPEKPTPLCPLSFPNGG